MGESDVCDFLKNSSRELLVEKVTMQIAGQRSMLSVKRKSCCHGTGLGCLSCWDAMAAAALMGSRECGLFF